jgi:chemotaxis signal transduction protein
MACMAIELPSTSDNNDPITQGSDSSLERYLASFFVDCVGVEKNSSERQVEDNSTKHPLKDAAFVTPMTEEMTVMESLVESSKQVAIEQPFVTAALSKPSPLAIPLELTKHRQKVDLPATRRILIADRIPSDVTLSEIQKRDLQRLFDKRLIDDAMVEPLTPTASLTTLSTEPLPKLLPPETSSPIVGLSRLDNEEELLKDDTGVDNSNSDQGLINRAVALHKSQATPSLAPVMRYRAHWRNERPDWAQSKFDVLLFSCRGASLAIPLLSLGHIFLQKEPLNHMPAMPSWVAGVIPVANNSMIKVINAGAFFLPEREARPDSDPHLHLLTLADSQWAFAVESIANPITLSDGDIQWRTETLATPWLAGAIKRQMCVLIDAPALLKSLSLST